MPYLLFAYRKAPQDSTGFSPFEILYGHRVRGPLDILREGWTDEKAEEVPAITHVITMRNRLSEMAKLAQDNLKQAQGRQKRYYDSGARLRSVEQGDEVLVLLPMQTNKLKLEWRGPYKVTRKVTDVDYEIQTPGRRQETKVYHINMMKKWNPSPANYATALSAELEREDETEGLPPTSCDVGERSRCGDSYSSI